MEPPAKRLKLGQALYDNDSDDGEANIDELSMSPTQFDARQDPLYELDKGRAKAATRLKSAFERIFEKYERDFTGVGDEIDLETGQVIIDNGHLQSLKDEKVRAREASVLSNDEERIARTKDVGSATKVKSKSSAKTTSSAHHPDRGSPAGSNPSGMFYNGPSDPLWQAPEIPIPYHQGMFGMMGQAMGYTPPLGQVYAPMLAQGGGYGTGFLTGVGHHRVSTKFPYMKTPKRQPLAPVVSIEDDSEEDDVLLGNTTQEVQSTSTEIECATSPLAERKDAQLNQKRAKQNTTIVSEQVSPKPRRGPGRPRKDSSPAKSQEIVEETVEGNAESRDATSRVPAPEPANEATVYFAVAPISRAPSEEVSTLAKQIRAKLARIRASIPDDTAFLYSQSRESSQSRKQVEASDEKSHGLSTELSDTSTATAKACSDASGVPPERTKLPAENVISGGSSQEGSHDVSLDSADGIRVDKETIADSKVNTRARGDPDEPSNQARVELDHVPNEDSSYVGDAAALAFAAGNTREPETSYPNNSISKEPEILLGDKATALHNKPRSPKDIQDDRAYRTPPVSDQDSCSNRGDHQVANFENQTAKDTDVDVLADAEVAPNDPMVNAIVDNPEEAHQSNIPSEFSQEVAQSPPRTEPDQTNSQLSEVQQRQELPPATDTTEPEAIADGTMSQSPLPTCSPGQCGADCVCRETGAVLSTHTSEITIPECGADEVCLKGVSLSAQETQAHKLEMGPIQSSTAEKIEVAFRPPPAHNKPSSTNDSEHVPDRNLPPNSNLRSVPSTPKKRQRSGLPEPGSRSRLSTPARKTYPLIDLIPALDDEDELSVLSSDVPSSPFSFNSFPSLPRTKPKNPRGSSSSSKTTSPRKTGRRYAYLEGPDSSSRGQTPSSYLLHRPPATESRVLGGGGKKKRGFDGGSGPQSSPLPRTVVNRGDLGPDRPDLLASTPSRRQRRVTKMGGAALDDVDDVRTPGGTVRKCGVDGFVCDRDFCFTCCR